MKKLIAVILSILSILAVFAFTSCDQESVDAMRESFINTGKDIFGPFFKISDSHKDNNKENSDDELNTTQGSSSLNEDKTDASSQSSSVDISNDPEI